MDVLFLVEVAELKTISSKQQPNDNNFLIYDNDTSLLLNISKITNLKQQ